VAGAVAQSHARYPERVGSYLVDRPQGSSSHLEDDVARTKRSGGEANNEAGNTRDAVAALPGAIGEELVHTPSIHYEQSIVRAQKLIDIDDLPRAAARSSDGAQMRTVRREEPELPSCRVGDDKRTAR
jgi:hypothetical protein